MVLHWICRIWPLRKRAVKTVRGSVRVGLRGWGGALMFEGRSEECVRDMSAREVSTVGLSRKATSV